MAWTDSFKLWWHSACKEGVHWRRRRPGIPTPKVPTPPTPQPVEYLINDPTTPGLVRTGMPESPPARPPFVVQGYRGGGFPRGSAEALAANCHVTLANTLRYLASQTDRPLQRWAAVSSLPVIPRAGVDLNAFYDRRSLQFFYFSDPRVGGTVAAADSSDVVAHELGHAVLDAYRPDTWSAASLEVAAFHEGFGDFVALVHILGYEEVVNLIVASGGDLRQPNVASRLAEQLGRAIYAVEGPGSRRPSDCLRSAINSFKYADPGQLPSDGPDDQIVAECHSFGRIIIGALYDILVMIYEDLRQAGENVPVAMGHARDQVTRYALKAIQNVPLNHRFFQAFAKTILWADVVTSQRRYHDRMRDIFIARNILTPEISMLAAGHCESEDRIVRVQGSIITRLGDHVVRVQADNPLYDVEVEIPCEQAYLFDENKNLYDTLVVTEQESLGAAQDMIHHLHRSGRVGDGQEFEVHGNRLVRNRFDEV